MESSSPATLAPGELQDVFVSVVIVADGQFDIGHEIEAIVHRALVSFAYFELVIVDNNMSAAQRARARDWLETTTNTRIVRVARRSSLDVAVFAGLEAAIGDYVVTMSPGSDPLESLEEIVAELRRGTVDVVQGRSSQPLGDAFLERLGRSAFYSYNRRVLGIELSDRDTRLIGLTRRALNAVSSDGRRHRYLRHLIQHSGLTVGLYTYAPSGPRRSERKLGDGIRDAVEMVSSYSTTPLRFVSMLALTAAILNLLYVLYILIVAVVLGTAVEGWATTSLQLSFMFVMIGIVLAVQSEYMARILKESRREPDYLLIEEIESPRSTGEQARRNVAS
ncbi:hypothetical protein GCM10009792_22180 [Microcella alkalica]|uniref:Glycosyltransferase 2-like domain-containing protein n=1 Tax=Microcella alkalica TaxID=355930 RepID=A0A839E9G8_9MICO|nr:glycosyltransferase [Microcella alkalica]MBA8848137.1 hypothetical protein [Microcella alkalica]